MNTKTLTFLIGLGALLAGAGMGAGVALTMANRSESFGARTPLTTINSATPLVPKPDAATVVAEPEKKASRLEEIHARLEQCYADPEAVPAKLYACLSQMSAADLQAIVQSDLKFAVFSTTKPMALHFLFKADPSTATQYVRAKLAAPVGGSVTNDLEASSALREWAMADPASSLQWVSTQPTNTIKHLLWTALPDYGGINPAGALQSIVAWNIDDGTKAVAISLITERAAHQDLPAGLAAIQAMPPGKNRSVALADLLNVGATVDPKNVLEFALQNTIKNQGVEVEGDLVKQVAINIADDDPEMVLNMAKNVTDPRLRASLEAGVMPVLTRQDPQRAWIFATTQFDGADQANAVGIVCHDAARNNPDIVAGWITQMPAGAAKNRACEMLLFQWSEQEPDRAAAWVLQLPDDQNKVNQISRVINHWATQDPEGSAHWIDSLPMGKARDTANSTYAWRVVDAQPTAALDRAASISDPASQQRVLSYLYKRVVSADPAAANSWVQQANLPDSEKQKILAQGAK